MAINLGNFRFAKFKLSDVYGAYFAMSPREQTIALVLAGILLFLVVVLPVALASGRIRSLEKEEFEGKRQMREVMRAIENYENKRAELSQVQKQLSGGFDASLSSTIESIADANGIKDRIDSLKEKSVAPSDIFEEMSVDVKLKRVSLSQLVGFLHAIENNPDKSLHLKQLSLKSRFDNKQEMDASFTVSTYKLLESAVEGS